MIRRAFTLIALISACTTHGDVLFKHSGEFAPGKEQTFHNTVAIPPPPVDVGLLATSSAEGDVHLTILDADGKELLQSPLNARPVHIVLGNPAGPLDLTVAGSEADGAWQVALVDMPETRELYPLLATGPLMIIVAMAPVLWWRRKTGAWWRWFWIGAAVWTVGVALKVVWALVLNAAILRALENGMPPTAYLASGSVYIGLLTGVFEIGVTLGAACIWRRMAATPVAAIAVGIGAGSFEAFLLGLGGLANAGFAVSGLPGTGILTIMAVVTMGSTPVAWLIGPIERIIAIACHVGSRALTLLTVAGGKWRYFGYGFVIMTAIDSVAGYAYLAELIGEISLWWIELAIAPAALVSAWATWRCYRNWPPLPVERPKPASAEDMFADTETSP